MGYDVYTMSASARLSRHNAPRDDADNEAWNAFMYAVREAAAANNLSIEVEGTSDLPTNQWSHDE